jgi:hypothetical protein
MVPIFGTGPEVDLGRHLPVLAFPGRELREDVSFGLNDP